MNDQQEDRHVELILAFDNVELIRYDRVHIVEDNEREDDRNRKENQLVLSKQRFQFSFHL